MAKDIQSDGPSKKVNIYVQVLGLLTAVIAIAVSTYFGIRSDTSKALQIEYQSIRPLLSIETNSSSDLRVEFGGNEVKSPGLLTLAIENIGKSPIEEEDIDLPVTINFPNAKVIGAYINERNPANIVATVSTSNDKALVEHGLLNPGDKISLDIVFDGRIELPVASARISGVKNIDVIPPTGRDNKDFNSSLPIPRPAIIVLLGFVSVMSLSMLAVGLGILVTAMKNFFLGKAKDDSKRRWEMREFDTVLEISSADPVLLHILKNSSDNQASLIFSAIKRRPRVIWLENENLIDEALKNDVLLSALNVLGLSQERAKALIKKEIQKAFYNRIISAFPSVFGEDAKRSFELKVADIDFENSPPNEIVTQTRDILEEFDKQYLPPKVRGTNAVDVEDVVFPTMFLLWGGAASLLNWGIWKSLAVF